MFNPNTIILGLFVVAGLLATTWAWFNIAKARKILKWPNVNGVIKESKSGSIVFSYTIKKQTYNHTMDFPIDITPVRESTENNLNKYPQGKKVTVYYQPDNPENATIEPGLGNDMWLIFALSIGATLLGITLLFL